MSENPYIEAREQLPSAIRTLPSDYLKGNAAKLLAIVEELRRSYVLELRVIQDIKSLDVTDPDAVAEFTQVFENYHQYRGFDEERTHCHNIDRVARTLLIPLQASSTATDRQRVGQVEDLLEPLRIADNDFLDEIEPLMDRALAVAKEINDHVQATGTDPARLDAAREEHEAFVQEFDAKVEALKANLRQMNTLANDLIDCL